MSTVALTRVEAYDAICAHCTQALHEAGFVDTQIKWENLKDEVDTTANYARPYIRHAESRRIAIGTGTRRRFKQSGVLWIKIFVLNGTGASEHVPVAQKVTSYFERLRSPHVSYVRIKAVEDGTHGSFFVIDFTADFSYDVFN